jgi:hypothetical protein
LLFGELYYLALASTYFLGAFPIGCFFDCITKQNFLSKDPAYRFPATTGGKDQGAAASSKSFHIQPWFIHSFTRVIHMSRNKKGGETGFIHSPVPSLSTKYTRLSTENPPIGVKNRVLSTNQPQILTSYQRFLHSFAPDYPQFFEVYPQLSGYFTASIRMTARFTARLSTDRRHLSAAASKIIPAFPGVIHRKTVVIHSFGAVIHISETVAHARRG